MPRHPPPLRLSAGFVEMGHSWSSLGNWEEEGRSQAGRYPCGVTRGDSAPVLEPLQGMLMWLLRPGEATLLGVVFWPRWSLDTAAAAVLFPGEMGHLPWGGPRHPTDLQPWLLFWHRAAGV